MADQVSWTKQAGATPGKLVLVAALAIVLGGVLYLQFKPAAEPVSTSARPAAATASSAPAARHVKSPSRSTDAQPKQAVSAAGWQLPELAAVVKYDPFALPAAFPKIQAADSQVAAQVAATSSADQRAVLEAEQVAAQAQLQGLRQKGVDVIIKRKDTYVALVGNQEIHVGDQIDGFTVIAIDADGVKVAKDLTP